MTALLQADGLSRVFPVPGGTGVLTAVDQVNLVVEARDILGVVGESGCGKTTLARVLAGIIPPTGGRVRFKGVDLGSLPAGERRRARAKLQYVYQDPGASLDPRWTIGRSLAEPLVAHTRLSRTERGAEVRRILRAVGLREEFLSAYPHELSGGQQRRVGLARVLTLRPELVILDEPTAGLDVSVQATILRLFLEMAREFGLTYVFISHDLAVVEAICTHVAVMYLGQIVEAGPAAAVFAAPQHPYTQSLLAAVPAPGGRRVVDAAWLEGEVPDPMRRPAGCRFHPRCPMVRKPCLAAPPALLPTTRAGHAVACLFAADLQTPMDVA